MKYICLIGSTGMLGSILLYELSKLEIQIIAISRSKFKKNRFFKLSKNIIFIEGVDVNNFENITSIINKYPINFIVNCVGIIKQKNDSRNKKLMYLINSVFPNKLSVVADLLNIKLIHISTDCVFSGKKGNYKENDELDAQDIYGISKALGEVQSKNCLTLRTSIIGHEIDSNKSLLEWFLSQKQSIKGYKNAIFSGFTNLELSKIIIKVIEFFPNLEGLYNLAADPISKYELLRLIAYEYKIGTKIIPYDEFKINRSLDGNRFRTLTNIEIKQWKVMISELHNFYKTSDLYV